MQFTHRIAPCLGFSSQAEEAARFCTSTFGNARIVKISCYGNAGKDVHHMPAGTVMTVAYKLDGQPFTTLTGGPLFKSTARLGRSFRGSSSACSATPGRNVRSASWWRSKKCRKSTSPS